MKRELYKQAADSLKQSLPVSLQCSMDLAQVKGASTWLTSLPNPGIWICITQVCLSRCLGSSESWLQLATIVSSLCLHVLGAQSFCWTCSWALSFPKSGFPFIWHNEIRDLTANLLSKVCNNVCTEPCRTSAHQWRSVHRFFIKHSGWCQTRHCR